MSRPPKSRRRDSRAEILKAARLEFAARGFDGAGIERIARRARVNKAMLYYHFGSKLALYRHVVREGLGLLVANARAATAGSAAPIHKFDAYVGALLHTVTTEQHLVPLLLREVAGGGRQLDPDTLRLMTSLLQVVRDLMAEGRARGDFRDVDPALTHFVLIGSAMVFIANAPIRARVRDLDATMGIPDGTEPFARHLRLVLRRTLCVDPDEI